MDLKPEVIERLKKLEEKYQGMGQDLTSYLDGLLYSNVTTYWDYTNVDKLLTLQNPKTDFPDEMIFIAYHQITELYFKLVLHELKQIANNGRNISTTGEDKGWNDKLNVNFFIERVGRVNRYFEALTKSFDIMVDGMEPEQFLRYRMALLPASGFQSGQYRMIEIYAADFVNLVLADKREQFKGAASDEGIEKMYQYIYWKTGATELETGKKTLTLRQFETKYSAQFIELGKECRTKNMWAKYKSLTADDQKNPKLIEALRTLDANVNVNWPLVHYKSAVKYLNKNENDTPATGGTNWQKYLPPRFQRRIFYPELWSADELENWGKAAFHNLMQNK